MNEIEKHLLFLFLLHPDKVQAAKEKTSLQGWFVGQLAKRFSVYKAEEYPTYAHIENFQRTVEKYFS